MSIRDESKDLLGKRIRRRRPQYESALQRHELMSVPERAERIRWLNKIIPKGSIFAMPLQSMKVFEEAKDCFVYGLFVASQVLAASFIEHWLGAILQAHGENQVAGSGLQAIVTFSREKRLIPPGLCDKIDTLRLNRNPFVHLKPFDHRHGLGRRTLARGLHPEDVLESDAREAMVAMYSVARYAKTQP